MGLEDLAHCVCAVVVSEGMDLGGVEKARSRDIEESKNRGVEKSKSRGGESRGRYDSGYGFVHLGKERGLFWKEGATES